jgi:hypothetical protein
MGIFPFAAKRGYAYLMKREARLPGSDAMKPPRPPVAKEQQLLRNARREGLLIMTLWLVALLWSVSAAYVGGYGRDVDDIRLVLGMPDWVFWSVVAPWGACLTFSSWFCFRYMADDPLGKDMGDEDAAGPGGHP